MGAAHGPQVGTGRRLGIESPKGIPLWVVYGAGAFVALLIGASLAASGSWLPLWVQIPLAGLTLLPWIPGGVAGTGPKSDDQLISWTVVVLSIAPTLVLTWTGASPLLFGVLALSASHVAFTGSLRSSIAYGVGATAIVTGRQFVAHHDFNWMVWKTYVELGLALGWAMRSQRLLVARTKQARTGHEQLAALEERRRIARDVHDVLAHTLTILMVHVNSARLAVGDDPEEAAQLLDEVARHGRHCLVEIRQTVGLLSEASPPDGLGGPIEAARAIEDLVASYRNAGLDVDLRLDVEMAHMGLLVHAPADRWYVGYRIVQESLANATKHAPGARVDVRISVDDLGLHLSCTNMLDTGAVMLELPSGGNGVRGMRERVEAVGGVFAAGPAGDVWQVRADLALGGDGRAGRPPAELGRAS